MRPSSTTNSPQTNFDLLSRNYPNLYKGFAAVMEFKNGPRYDATLCSEEDFEMIYGNAQELEYQLHYITTGDELKEKNVNHRNILAKTYVERLTSLLTNDLVTQAEIQNQLAREDIFRKRFLSGIGVAAVISGAACACAFGAFGTEASDIFNSFGNAIADNYVLVAGISAVAAAIVIGTVIISQICNKKDTQQQAEQSAAVGAA